MKIRFLYSEIMFVRIGNIIIILMLTFWIKISNGQSELSYGSINATAEKLAPSLVQKLKEFQSESRRQIMVMPIYDQSGRITNDSKRIAEKIAHYLNLRAASGNSDFNARSYFEFLDPLLSKIVDSLGPRLIAGDLVSLEEFYRKIEKAKEIDYVIVGSYIADFSENKLTVENVKIITNWNTGTLVTPEVPDVRVPIINTGPVIVRSLFVPGLGQLYKKEKAKGWCILSSEIVCGVGIVVSNEMSNNYYEKAIQNRNSDTRKQYLSYSNNWTTARNAFIVGAAGIYIYNLIDALLLKNRKEYACLKKPVYQFYTSADEKNIGITFRINLK